VDGLAEILDEPIRAQIGRSDYIPENAEWFRFTSEEEIHELYRTASVVVAHAGAGTILTALSYEKPIVILPRREEYGEHNDDHQWELASALDDRPGVYVVEDTSGMRSAIERALAQSNGTSTQNDSLTQFLADYIGEIET
jgi:UDP-N-acetylglucosamine transferase subunit ALG13